MGLLVCLKLIILTVSGIGCGFTGCDAVLSSSYASVFGVSLASLGFGYYAGVLFLLTQSRLELAYRLVSFALVTVVGLILIQAFVINAWCVYCLLSAGLTVGLWGILSGCEKGKGLKISKELGILLACVLILGLVVEFVVGHSLRTTTSVVSINGQGYSLDEVDARLGLSGAELEQQKNALRHKWLRSHLVDIDTQARGITKSQLYAELVSQYKADIMTGLKEYENTLFDTYDVKVNFPLPKTVSITDNRYGSIGDIEKKEFHLVEFIDLECGHCRKIHHDIKALKDAYPEKLSIEIRHFPLKSHKNAKQAAQLAWCLNNQNLGAAFIDAVFSAQDGLTSEKLIEIGMSLGADQTTLGACISDPSSFEAIKEDIRIAEEIGVSSTPAVFVNNRFIRSVDEIETMILNAR